MMNRSGEPCDRARLHHHPSLSWYPIKPDHALAKDHGLASVDQHALFGHPAHRAREYLRLGIAADADQFVDAVAVIDALDRLFDDRPLVEIARHEMRAPADQLAPALHRAVLGLGALEARRGAGVSVYAAPAEPPRPGSGERR